MSVTSTLHEIHLFIPSRMQYKKMMTMDDSVRKTLYPMELEDDIGDIPIFKVCRTLSETDSEGRSWFFEVSRASDG